MRGPFTQPVPVNLLLRALAALGVAAITLLALAAPRSDAFIYWADSQTQKIGRADNDGSGINGSFIQTGQVPFAIAIDSGHIYWVNQNSDTIGRANIDGTGVNNSFITGVNEPSGIAVNATSIFWSTIPGLIGRANIDGTNKKTNFITGPGLGCGVALDSGHIYWADGATGTPAYIGRAGLDGSNVELHFSTIPGTSTPCGIAVDAANIYWTDIGFLGPNGTKIGRANKITGEGADPNFIGGALGPCGITIFDSKLYWPNAGMGTIGRANTDATGVNQSFFATGGEQVCGIAINSLASPPLPPPSPAPPSPTSSAPPQTTILKGPGGKLAQGEAKFSFKSSQDGSRFECKLDRRKATKCKSPQRYAKLKPGAHVFKVWAINSAGAKDPTPATKRFRIPSH